MALICAGTVVGFEERDWQMTDDDTGALRSGTSRTLTLSTGDGTEAVKFRPEDWDALSKDEQTKLRQFGRPLVVRCTARANAREGRAAQLALTVLDIDFCRMADIAALGVQLDIYVEEPAPAGPAPVAAGNGATAKV